MPNNTDPNTRLRRPTRQEDCSGKGWSRTPRRAQTRKRQQKNPEKNPETLDKDGDFNLPKAIDIDKAIRQMVQGEHRPIIKFTHNVCAMMESIIQEFPAVELYMQKQYKGFLKFILDGPLRQMIPQDDIPGILADDDGSAHAGEFPSDRESPGSDRRVDSDTELHGSQDDLPAFSVPTGKPTTKVNAASQDRNQSAHGLCDPDPTAPSANSAQRSTHVPSELDQPASRPPAQMSTAGEIYPGQHPGDPQHPTPNGAQLPQASSSNLGQMPVPSSAGYPTSVQPGVGVSGSHQHQGWSGGQTHPPIQLAQAYIAHAAPQMPQQWISNQGAIPQPPPNPQFQPTNNIAPAGAYPYNSGPNGPPFSNPQPYQQINHVAPAPAAYPQYHSGPNLQTPLNPQQANMPGQYLYNQGSNGQLGQSHMQTSLQPGASAAEPLPSWTAGHAQDASFGDPYAGVYSSGSLI